MILPCEGHNINMLNRLLSRQGPFGIQAWLGWCAANGCTPCLCFLFNVTITLDPTTKPCFDFKIAIE